jgi:glycosyltransferase involved in cell wall biosynthesis
MESSMTAKGASGAAAPRAVAIVGLGRTFAAEHRIRNQIKAFSGRHPVHGYGTAGLDSLDRFQAVSTPPRVVYRVIKLLGILFPGLRIRYERWWYRPLTELLRAEKPRLAIVHNIPDALATRAAGVPYVFDSHEYLPRQFDGSLMWRLTEIRYRRKALQDLLGDAALITVEGEIVAAKYAEEFPGSRGKFLVARNAPAFSPRPAPPLQKGRRRRLIHHGILVPERGLEKLMDIVLRLGPDYELTLMGGGEAAYVERLKSAARQQGNVIIKDPVPYARIVETLYDYDLSLVVFGSPHYHHRRMTVPNKFWESLQARVPVVVAPESAMAPYIRESGCGLVPDVDVVDAYVKIIRGLGDDALADMKALLERKAYEHSLDAWITGYADTLLARIPDSD